jgi:hypothetical protein
MIAACPDHSEEIHPMKAVILAGGLGSRISEETSVKPKPMVEIGGPDPLACDEDLQPSRDK